MSEQPSPPPVVPPHQPTVAAPAALLDATAVASKLMEHERSMGQLDEVRRNVEKLSNKVDELMAFKNKLLGMVALAAFLGAVVMKAVDYLVRR